MTNSIFIYALRDPETDEVHYVGRTNSLRNRLTQHLKDRADSKKVAWLKELRAKGLTPSVKVLERVPENDAHAAELKWIQHYAPTGLLKNIANTEPENKEVEKLKRQLQKQTNSRNQWFQMYRQAEKGIGDLRSSLQFKEMQMQKLQKEVTALKSSVQDKDSEIERLRFDVRKITAQSDYSRIKTLESIIQTQKETYECQQSLMKAKDHTIDTLVRQRDALEKQERELLAHIEVLDESIATLRKPVEDKPRKRLMFKRRQDQTTPPTKEERPWWKFW